MKLQLKPLSRLPLLAATLVGTGCLATFEPAEEEEPEGETVATGDGDGGTSVSPGDGDDAGDGDGDGDNLGDGDGATVGDGDCPTEPCSTPGDGDAVVPEPPTVEVHLPVVVTNVFAPSGFMGTENTLAGYPNETEGIIMNEAGCEPTQRAAGAAGVCFAVTYTPQYLPPCTEAQLLANPDCTGGTWAGVQFQNPSLNWGEVPGVAIEPGATKVVFTAWTNGGELTLNFLAGGIGGPTTLYRDSFQVQTTYSIGPTPTQYELDLSSATYERVLGGFGWTIPVNSPSTVEFFLDDIRWVAE